MKLLLLLLFFSVCSSPTYAYKEVVKSAKEVQATAGEQNTNLYRLNAASLYNMKQLKKMSDAMVRNPELRNHDVSTINTYLGEDDTESAVSQLQELYNEVVAATKDSKKLVVDTADALKNLELALHDVAKDDDVVLMLSQKIRRK